MLPVFAQPHFSLHTSIYLQHIRFIREDEKWQLRRQISISNGHI